MNTQTKEVKICPLCGSTDINTRMPYDGAQCDFCRDCGHGYDVDNRIFPLIKQEEVENFRKEIKNKEL